MQQSAYESIEPTVTGLSGVLHEALGVNGDSYQMISSVLGASHVVDNYYKKYGKKGSVIASDLAFLEEHRSSDKARKQVEWEAKSKLGEVRALLDKIRMLGSGAAASMERYQILHQFYEDNVSFNNGLESQSSDKSEVSSDPYAAGSSAMKDIDGIYAAMSGIMGALETGFFKQSIPRFIFSILMFQS